MFLFFRFLFFYFSPQPVVEEPVEDLTRDLDSLVIEEATEGEAGLDLKKVSHWFTRQAK